MHRLTLLVIALFATGFVACESPSPEGDEGKASQAQEQPTKTDEQPDDPNQDDEMAGAQEAPDFTGDLKRGAILEGSQQWAQRYKQANVDEEVAEALSQVEPGARVEIYLGVWCEDSMREVPRFWRALDVAGVVPFAIEHIGLNESFSAGDVSLEGLDIEAVPTFIVYRDGEEVGRIVEDAPENIETHLLALLTGDASGVISASR